MELTDIEEVTSKILKIVPRYRLDYSLIQAIAKVESNFDRWAVRYEAGFSYLLTPEVFAKKNKITVSTETQCQKMSWGLLQIMGGTARDLGFTGPLTQLLEIENNLKWGCKYLVKLGEKHGMNSANQVAAWNAGSVRQTADGDYVNQIYVDKVLEAWRL